MLSSVKEKLSQIVGAQNVVDDPAALSVYGGKRAFVDYCAPALAVRAHSGVEVEKIVGIALEEGIPVVPVSSAAPHRTPGSAPSVEGALVIDLSEMKKIHSITRRFCMAIIEPGVTFEELLPALEMEGLTIQMPLAPRSGKSVIASLLEVEPRKNAATQWNYVDPLRCTEVTWGDGTRMFTGEAGGGARDLDKQQAQGKWQINGGGPMMIDFCRLLTGSQGSMGIVTWASVKCEPISERNVRHTVAADKEEDLIDFVYELLRLRFTDGLYILNDAYLAHLAGEAKVDIAPWQAVIEISGHNFLPDLRISQQQGDISDFAAKHGLTLSEHTEGLFALTHGPKVLPANERLFFITTLERTPAFIAEMNRMASELGIDPAQIGVYIQPQHQGTNCHCEFLLPDCAQAPALYFAAAERFAGMGAYYSRPQGPILTNLQLGKDPQTAHTMATVKGIFDPKNIMNPGKLTLKEDAK